MVGHRLALCIGNPYTDCLGKGLYLVEVVDIIFTNGIYIIFMPQCGPVLLMTYATPITLKLQTKGVRYRYATLFDNEIFIPAETCCIVCIGPVCLIFAARPYVICNNFIGIFLSI